MPNHQVLPTAHPQYGSPNYAPTPPNPYSSSPQWHHDEEPGSTSTVQISVGCDPEMFLEHDESHEMRSAHDLLPGTKALPHAVPYGAIQVDGVAAEINIAPAFNPTAWCTNLTQVQNALKGFVPGYTPKIVPAYEFNKDYFKTIPEEFRQLGCNPDYNAWTGLINPAPCGDLTSLRTASGHIHVGWTNVVDPHVQDHFDDCCTVAKQLDYYMGMYTLLWDRDSRRRSLYGKAGAFRPKSYGIEYRTPSNVWLKYPNLYPWIWYAAYQAVHGLLGNSTRMFDQFGTLAQETIDGNKYDFVLSSDFKLGVHPHTGLEWPKW